MAETNDTGNGSPGSPDRRRRIVATYDYTDEGGALLYQVVRYDPKGFRQRRPNGNGGWTWSLGDVRRVLYRLPELVESAADGRPLFIVEGEKDADNLRALGVPATTCAMGAGKWRPEYTEGLAGREVIIIPDNDDPGRAHAEAVAEALAPVAASVKVVQLPDLPPKGDVSDWLAAGHTKEELLTLALRTDCYTKDKHAPKSTTRPGEAELAEAGAPARPVITITTEEHQVNAAAACALARDEGVYQRGGILVRVVRDASPAAGGIRRPLAPRIEMLPAPLLRERLAANAHWIALRSTRDGIVEEPAHPPAWCVSAVHARGDWPGVWHLEGVVEYPVLRPDGTILDQPGYDPHTGLLLEPAGPVPAIPESPSRDEAVAALGQLLEVVSDFPFERPVHRAAYVAALLTPLARFAYTGPSPLFLVDANVRAAGKGLLLDTISRIVTGERFTIATYTDDEDELRKRITSLVLEGDRLVLFDNLAGQVGNAVLDAALTSTAWGDRLLGVNRTVKGPMYMTWYATGNNVAVAADTARRVCHIRLESPQERPELRQDFQHPDLLAWVGQHRGTLLAAALTMLRAYFVAGRPDQDLRAWGSFEGWSALVRSAVVWIGMPDPGETRLLLQEHADVTAEAMGIFLRALEQLDSERRGHTAAEIIQMLRDDPPTDHVDLRDAVEGLVGKLDARLLGNKLRSYRRRVFAGRYLDYVGIAHGAKRWAAFPAAAFRQGPENTPQTPHTPPGEGECGESGESVSPQAGADSTAPRRRRGLI
jgi:hypothetical protein